MSKAMPHIEKIEIPMDTKGGHVAIHHFKPPPPRKGLSPWESRKEPETHVFGSPEEVGEHVSSVLAAGGHLQEGHAPKSVKEPGNIEGAGEAE